MENKRPEYLDYSVTKLPDSVEVYFCEPLDKNGKKESMDNDLSRLFITLCMVKDPEVDEMYNQLHEAFPLVKIISSRAEFSGLKIDKKTTILLSCICSSPGQAVMYIYYLLYKSKKLGLKELSFNHVSMEIFPFGFFTEETLNRYWDLQKVNRDLGSRGSDNLLDYPEASKSLAFI
jgi:hypothetical protein